MYIGAIPTPAATESRQEFTATANQTVFNTTGGTVGYCDCYLNGVKLAASDFSFDGADVTLTTGAAAGDVLAVVMRQADNALVALPIKDSSGNNVIHEAGGVVKFPAGHVIQTITDEHLGINNPGNIAVIVSVQTDMQAELGSLLECKITPISTSNKLIIHCFIAGVYNQNQNTAALHAGFAIGSFNSSGVGTTLGPRDIITSHEGYSSVITLDSMMYMLVVPPPSAGSEITIRPTFAAANGPMNILANPSQDCAYMTVQEIQQ